MKKIIILFFLSSFCSSIFAQSDFLEENAIPYRKGDLWGYANKYTGEILVKPVYDSAYMNWDKLSIVTKNRKQGLISSDNDGHCFELISPMYDYISYNRGIDGNIEGYYVSNINKKGFIDLDGTILLPAEYKKISMIKKNYYSVKQDKEYSTAVYNKETRKFITPFIYEVYKISGTGIVKDNTKELEEGGNILLKNSKDQYFYINTKGEVKLFSGQLPKKMEESNTVSDVVTIVLDYNKAIDFSNKCSFNNLKKVKFGKDKYFKTNCTKSNYMLIKQKKTMQFGLSLNDSLVVEPIYDAIDYINLKDDKIVFLLKKDSKITLFYNDSFLTSNEYDEVLYNRENNFLLLKKRNLLGFLFLENNKDNKSYIIVPQFMKVYEVYQVYKDQDDYSRYFNKEKDFKVFKVMDMDGKSYFVSNKGMIYYEK